MATNGHHQVWIGLVPQSDESPQSSLKSDVEIQLLEDATF